MFKWRNDIIVVLIVLSLFFVLSYPLNDWLSLTMPRHQLIQLPAIFVLGVIMGFCFPKVNVNNASYGIAILIFVMTSLIFWMLPRSVDLAVIHPAFNRVMHLNMILSGFFTTIVLRNIFFEIKIFFLGMMSAMLLATGIALKSFEMLLCSSFNIQQQKETGFYLILTAIGLFAVTLSILFRGLTNKNV